MNKQAAINLIVDTFNSSFNENRFRNFIRNLFNEFDENKNASWITGYIKDSFKDHVKKYKRIGKYKDIDGNKLDVVVVHLRKESALDSARTMQRNFIASYLKTRGEKDAAVVAYFTDNTDDWRFSYIRMEYRQEITESGKIKVKEDFTPRRCSFLVGKNEPNHTAQQQLFPILCDDQNNPSLSELEKAFSVEVVTKQFYQDYKGLFEKLTEELDRILEEDNKIKREFESKAIDTANFAKKLLGQIVFLYFLQKKGWLGVGKDDKGDFKSWGTGPKNFLRQLLEKKYIRYNNFFNDVLEPLFYEALATERPSDYYSRFNCKIPFLNGGLFEPIGEYNWQETDILINNDLFSEIFETFDQYNFTVREDEPLEKEVAVDPEMLGKVFENLLPGNLRKGQGAYYTPREIVHYMCRESLINYIDTAVNTGEISLAQEKPTQGKLFGTPEPKQLGLKTTGYKTVIPRKDIEAFIRKGEFAIEYEKIMVEKTANNKNYKGNYKKEEIAKTIRDNAQLLDEKLASIKICDPAIGSGAFPVGMMHEIIKARNVLTTYLDDKTKRSIYEFKRHCIQQSLYGVDIDPGAIDIAKLRLWLSLIVDEDDYHDIKPLPNLDYKIMQGNSLIEEFHGISLNLEKENKSEKPFNMRLFNDNKHLDKLIENLHNKQDRLFLATHPEEKRLLKRNVEDAVVEIFHYELQRSNEEYFRELKAIKDKIKIIPKEKDKKEYYDKEKAKLDKRYKFDFAAVENELREMTRGNKERNFFPWKLYFADVFRKNGGFDVVIANPPYIRIQKIEKPLKQAFSKNYQSATKNYDIYTLFDEKGINLLRAGGFFAYIQPNKFFNADYGVGLRKFLSTNAYLYKLVNFGNTQMFDTATTYTTLLFCRKSDNSMFEYVAFSGQDGSDEFTNYVSRIPSANIIRKRFPKKYITSDNWVFADDNSLAIFEKIESTGRPLSSFTQKTFQGIVSSADLVYCLEEIDRRLWSPYLKEFVDIPFSDVKPLLKGKEIRRYCTEPNRYWLIFPYSLDGHRPKLYSESEYKTRQSEVWNYLKSCEKKLRSREKGKMNNDRWYAYVYPKNLDQFEQPKLMLQVLAKKASITLDEGSNYYFVGGGNAGGYGITLKKDSSFSYKYLLGLLNSALLDFYLQKHSSMFQNGYYSYAKRFIEKVPIVEVSKTEQKSIITLVDKILSLKKSDPRADTSALEAEIDRMVYELYSLTPEEIKIVEGDAK